MKNILKIIVFVFMCFISINICHAVENNIKIGPAIEGVKLYLDTPEKDGYIKNMYKLENETTGELLYCIEPGVQLYNGSFKRLDTPFDVTSITREQYDMISRYAFFGYNFPGREDIKWYVITQYAIWNYLLDGIGEVYFVDENEEKIEPYNDEIKALQDDVDKAYLIPSFAKNSEEIYRMRIGEEKTLTDTNGVLHKFDNNRVDGHPEYSIDGDALTIKYNSGGYYAFNFSKNTNVHGYAYVYFKDGSQVVVSRGYIDQPASYAYFYILYPRFNLQKKSSISCDLPLSGAEYKIYYKVGDSLLGTYTTDQDGHIYIDEIYNGNYYIVETKAPYGYKLNSEKTYFTVNNEDVELEMLEEPIVKKITFKKYLEKVDKVLQIEPDAEFQLYKKGSSVPIKTVTTDAHGEISFDLTYGNYILHQTKGTAGYTFISDYEFTIDDNYLEGAPIELKNPAITKRVKITKYLNNADGSFQVESDARFYLYNLSTGLLITELTTDHLGEASIYLPYGSYKLHQVYGKSGYNYIEDYIFTISDESPNLYEIHLRNEQIVKNLKIIKYLEKANHNLTLEPSAKFNLYDAKTGKLVSHLVTNAVGLISIDLPYGNYILQQTKGTEGYSFIEELNININEESNEVIEIILKNKEIIRELKITKYLENIDHSLKLEPDAEFSLINKLTNEVYTTIKTNKDGEVSLNLPYGIYILHQTKGTTGYYFIDDIEIVVDESSPEVIVKSLKNKQIEKEIVIKKFLENTNQEDKIEPNAEFNLYEYKTMKLIGTYKTNQDGKIKLKLTYGKYLLRQTKGTTGYSFIPDREIIIDDDSPTYETIVLKNIQIEKDVNIIKYLEAINGHKRIEPNAEFELLNARDKSLIKTLTTNEDGKINLKLPYGTYILHQTKGTTGYYNIEDYEFSIDDDTPSTLSIKLVNKQIIKNVKIIKYLLNYNGSKDYEKNAKFTLIDTKTKKVIKEFSTNKNGEFMLNLPYGTYILHQIKGTTGYHNIKDLTININDKTPLYQDIKLYNREIIKELIITKKLLNTDNTSIEEPNATFELYQKYSHKLINTFTTNKYGEFKLKLPYGTYILHQISGTKGYDLAPDLEIKIDDTNIYHDTYTIYNPQITGTLKIIKKDSLDNNLILRPAFFKIKNKDTLEYLKINNQDTWETTNGYLTIENIPYGNYILEEVIPPYNYKIGNSLEFSIINNHETITLDVLNDLMRGNILIEKLDAYTKKPLEGVIFNLYNENHELIGEYTTDNLGQIYINDLEIGTYYLKEIYTKDNYELTDDLIMVEVKDGITSSITVNNRHKITVPKTGSKEFLITIIISTLILLFGVYICNYAKKTN